MLELFAVGGWPPDVQYIFLGDYVDRGNESVEVFLLLLALKVKYPSRVTLCRGNHECRHSTINYGFYDECRTKYGEDLGTLVWCMICDTFDVLPLSAMVDNKLFCVHGGLSPDLPTTGAMTPAHARSLAPRTIDAIAELQRQREPAMRDTESQDLTDLYLRDLIWSDPAEHMADDWEINTRGAGWVFGQQATRRFLEMNGLGDGAVVRSHQLAMEGYVCLHDRRTGAGGAGGGQVADPADAMVVTVWSCPNYCYSNGNLASILEMTESLAISQQSFNVFDKSPYENRSLAARPTAERLPHHFK